MAIIQFVGFPEITPVAIIKCGYVPNEFGGVDWLVETTYKEDQHQVITLAESQAAAFKLVGELVKEYGGLC